MSETRPYGVLLTTTTSINRNLRKYATPTDFAVSADWTPAAGDVKISKDGGAAANITNLPTYTTDKGWIFILTAAELTCQQAIIRIADAATKAVCDREFIVETSGNASAMWPDPSDAAPVYAQLSAASLASAVSSIVTATWAKLMVEPTSVPAVTGTVLQGLSWLLAKSRNKTTATLTAVALRNDADNANLASRTVSDDGVTLTAGEWG